MATDGGADIELCSYYEKLEKEGTDAALQPGVYTLEELKRLGRTKGWCPYFLARHVISFANVVVYNYQYLLDPKIAQLVSSSMQRECVVVFDEAHNIDNICIEVMSINFRLPTLDAAQRNLGKLRSTSTASRRRTRAASTTSTSASSPASRRRARCPPTTAAAASGAPPTRSPGGRCSPPTSSSKPCRATSAAPTRSSASSPASSRTCAAGCRPTSSSSRRRPPSSRG